MEWSGFVKDGFVKDGFVKGGFVKHGFVKGGFVKHGFVKGGFVKGGFVKHGFVKGGFVKHDNLKLRRATRKARICFSRRSNRKPCRGHKRQERSSIERNRMLSYIIIKITISSLVIGLKTSYFPLIRLPSCYRTVCYWIVCYWTVCYRTV